MLHMCGECGNRDRARCFRALLNVEDYVNVISVKQKLCIHRILLFPSFDQEFLDVKHQQKLSQQCIALLITTNCLLNISLQFPKSRMKLEFR